MIANKAALEHTLNFIEPYITSRNIRFLEVGCGKGDLAFLLQDKVTLKAIDISAEAIAITRSKGIDAQESDFLKYNDELYDTIFFSYSLHHILPLTETITKAYSLLKPNGILIAEDFAADLVDQQSIDWLKEKAQEINIENKFTSLSDWHDHHFGKHQIANSQDMVAAVKKVFPGLRIQTTAYLFRYIMQALETNTNDKLISSILAEEMELIKNNKLVPIGLRLVAQRHG